MIRQNMNIEQLKIEDFPKCGNIWDMKKRKGLAEKFLGELESGNRITYVCKDGNEFIGEDAQGKYVKLIKTILD